MRRIWRFPRDSHCDIIPLITDVIPIELSLVCRFIKFFRTLLNSKNDTVRYICRTQCHGFSSVMGKNIRHIRYKYNISIDDMTTKCMSELRKSCIDMWLRSVDFNYVIHSDVIFDCVIMRDDFNNNVLSNEAAQSIIDYLCTI